MSDETGIDEGTAATDAPASAVTDCAEALRELEIFLDGELTDTQCDAVRTHLEGCMDCLGAFDFHAELKQVIATKCQNDEIPPDLVQRIERCFGTDLDGDGRVG